MAKKKAVEETPVSQFRNRIVGHAKIHTSQLVPHPLNIRAHPIPQAKALLEIMNDIGIAASLKVRQLPDGKYEILDGHLRKDLINQEVDIEILDLDDNEAKKFILSFDAVAMMAEAIESRIRELKKSVKIPDRIQMSLDKMHRAREEAIEKVQEIAAQIGKRPELAASMPDTFTPQHNESIVGTGDRNVVEADIDVSEVFGMTTDPDNYQGIYELRENVVFPSSNELGIPDLRSDMLCTLIPKETWANAKAQDGTNEPIADPSSTFFLWGTAAFPVEAQGGILGFFVDDARFEGVWTEAVRICQLIKGQKWGGVCTPDFSVWWRWPLAIKIYNLYRSRWVARYWQEAGIKIIPCLMRAGDPKSKIDVFGMPKNPPVVGMQCRAQIGDSQEEKEQNRKIMVACTNSQVQSIEPENVFIYGGLQHQEWLEPLLTKGPTYWFLEDWVSVRRRVSPTMRRSNEKKGKKTE